MLGYFVEANSVETVNARMGQAINPRLRQVMTSLISYLHTFVKDVQLTQAEWEYAINFLTRTGHICSEERQEFILLSDTLGVSMLVDAVNNWRPAGATENTVFGPFHVAGGPVRAMGYNVNLDGRGEKCLYRGRVVNLHGDPIAGAQMDVWSDNIDGFYDIQQPDTQPKWNNRGTFITGSDGAYHYSGIKPVSYPIPDDGPVGQMLIALGRHPYRPAHMHYLIVAEGYQKLVTHIFAAGDSYLESDTVFGVKKSLVLDFEKSEGGLAKWEAVVDFVLVPV